MNGKLFDARSGSREASAGYRNAHAFRYRHRPRVLALRGLVMALLFCSYAHADPAPAPGEVFPVEKIHPGLTGKVYTVMQGTEVVTLHAEIYGVLRNFIGPKVHLIVGKLVGERAKLTGAVHGMSGSPLYIEGKIAGALSYCAGNGGQVSTLDI